MSAPFARFVPWFSFGLLVFSARAGLASPAVISAESKQQLEAALRKDSVETLRLTWSSGNPSEGAHKELRIADGKAELSSCSPSCQTVGAALNLTPGERSQLVSRLRSADLFGLAASDMEPGADRRLEVAPPTSEAMVWQLPRAAWPVAPDGVGLADYLDELSRRIERSAATRPMVQVPKTVAELDAVRVQLRLRPRNSPGGLLRIEHGRLKITPEEGSLPRVPRPRPYERALSASEQESLVAGLVAAQLEGLENAVPKRAQPAIGDTDGRLATLHILPGESDGKDRAAASLTPRGVERYLADLLRSPAAPLYKTLVGWLVTEPSEGKAGAPPAPTAKAASRPKK